eukprot:TRINITY_DN77076_c0_g1_i1.p1 TRINITY_DN77076_c0_g1~~TRINITY_DN77076_c0_g1_i1.p1  ORF type:complete len:390 (+),score=47.00 TRINITY_DN77076_c0_g1_i1:46-1215(+)
MQAWGSMRSIRGVWARGGTSKALLVRCKDLPGPGRERDRILLAALGSPDPTGMQLNGLGGGLSSTSKVAVLRPSARPGFDIDYLFGQVALKERCIDWGGSCGNIASAVGLFALSEGWVKATDGAQRTSVNIWQQNTGVRITAHVQTGDNAVELVSVPGVPGRAPAIYVESDSPTIGGSMMPTGRAVDLVRLPDGRQVEATVVAAGNHTIFVKASDLGLRGTELPSDLPYSKLAPTINSLRTSAAQLLGLPEPHAGLRAAWVAPPADYATSGADFVSMGDTDILSRISTEGRIHHAHTGTGAIALACAASVKGSLVEQIVAASKTDRDATAATGVRIGHPGGVMCVKADVKYEGDAWVANGVSFVRTARYLMDGTVFLPEGIGTCTGEEA